MNTQETRTASVSPIQFARATAAFVVMLVMGYAFSTTPVESAKETALPPTTSVLDFGPGSYFPAQYTNQGTAAEEHIQAY
jgi:hypothetical protein